MALLKFAPFVAAAVLAFIGLRILSSSYKLFVKIMINTVLGIASIFVFNAAGRYIGVTLGINLFSGLVVGFCGPLGIVLLLIMRFVTF